MTNTIIFELCAEDRKRLDDILAALTTTEPAPQTAPQEAVKELPQPNTPTTEKNTTEAPQQAQEAPVGITRADIQQKVVELCAKGKKAAVREVVNAYAGKVSDINEADFAEVMINLEALED